MDRVQKYYALPFVQSALSSAMVEIVVLCIGFSCEAVLSKVFVPLQVRLPVKT